MSWKTTPEGRRPDLENLEVNDPFPYIGNRIYPTEFQQNSAGKLWYAPAQTEIVPQENRDPKTGEIVRDFAATANTTFATAEKIGRKSVTAEDVGNLGGVEQSDDVGGKMAKIAIRKKMEAYKALKLFTGTKHAVGNDVILAIQAGLAAIKKYSGARALVCSVDVYNTIIRSTAVFSRLSFSGVTLTSREDVLSLKPSILKEMLQQFFSVQEVLVGDNEVWGISGYAGLAAVVCLPSEIPLSYKYNAELGKTICYMMDESGKDFVIEANADGVSRINDYDGISYSDVVEFNAGAKYLISGIVPGFDASYSTDGSGFEYLGAYSAAANYSINDMVTFGGSLYISKANANLNHTPSTGSQYWGLAAAAGTSTYTYVAYASTNTGTGFSLTPSDVLKYRAEIHIDEEIETPVAADFSGATWVKYIGDDGV